MFFMYFTVNFRVALNGYEKEKRKNYGNTEL